MSKEYTEMLRRKGRKEARKARFNALDPVARLERRATRRLAKVGFYDRPEFVYDTDATTNKILKDFDAKQAELADPAMICSNGRLRRPW